MRRIRRLLIIVFVVILLAIAWFWWNRPRKVDMAAYVPADSLVYLESNSPDDIVAGITQTDAWRSLAPSLGVKATRWPHRWLAFLAKNTGIGPTKSVVAMRAQLAFVMLDLNAVGNGDTLELKPLAALVVETHTSHARIKPLIEGMIDEFARRAYIHPNIERENVDGKEFVKWRAPDGQRRIVVSVDDTVAIIGNDERAVSACIASRQGRRPSLLNQPGLNEMRARLEAGSALAFGYVSSANLAHLTSIMAPIFFGKMSNEFQAERLLTVIGSRVLGSAGWTAHSFSGSIEDRYLISLKAPIVSHLRSEFMPATVQNQLWQQLPVGTYSFTAYNLRDPAAAWDSLNAAVSAQVDAVSAFLFTNILRAMLVQYGIDQPETFLRSIKPQVLTVRLEQHSDRPLIIAMIRDEQTLLRLTATRLGPKPRTELIDDVKLLLSADGQSAAALVGDYFIMGSEEDVRRCLVARMQRTTISLSPGDLKALNAYANNTVPADAVTYANDGERVRAFVAALRAIPHSQVSPYPAAEAERAIGSLPYSVTATTLVEDGFERRTRSPFGQFGTLLSLLKPDQVSTGPH
jgi:hypothetical protein